MRLETTRLPSEPVQRFAALIGEAGVRHARERMAALRACLGDRSIWSVDTAMVGEVPETLRALLPYARDAGIDARWALVRGSPAFFRVVKHVHDALLGETGAPTSLDRAARETYDTVSRINVNELLPLVRPRDLVVLHDAQAAGLAPVLVRAGAIVVWRCCVGSHTPTAETTAGWAFLAPYLQDVDAYIFSREADIPPQLPRERCTVIPASIDPFAPKNLPMDDATVRAILVYAGLIDGPAGDGAPTFLLEDGAPGRVDHRADIIRLGAPPSWETPLVVHVARWDHLKDPVGTMEGFARRLATGADRHAQLLLVGPNVHAVVDTPDGDVVFDQVLAAWRALPDHCRQRVQLANLPMANLCESAAIINALQRHAAVVVQKSLREGFGLTVTEAMWKARPVVASAVGGVPDQIEDGVTGLLVRDPTDLDGFGAAVHRLLADPELAKQLGDRARERVRESFLSVRQLAKHADLFERLTRCRDASRTAAGPTSS